MKRPHNRGDRIANRAICKDRAKKHSKHFFGTTDSWTRFMHQSTPCSCWMCRNPRRNKGFNRKERLTLQERKHEEMCKKELFTYE